MTYASPYLDPLSFLQFDGYMAAVPSKHDLASFVRSIHMELALAVPTGSRGVSSEGLGEVGEGGSGSGGGSEDADLSMSPLLLKGVVSAVKLFCAKVEIMHSVEEVSQFFGHRPFLSTPLSWKFCFANSLGMYASLCRRLSVVAEVEDSTRTAEELTLSWILRVMAPMPNVPKSESWDSVGLHTVWIAIDFLLPTHYSRFFYFCVRWVSHPRRHIHSGVGVPVRAPPVRVQAEVRMALLPSVGPLAAPVGVRLPPLAHLPKPGRLPRSRSTICSCWSSS